MDWKRIEPFGEVIDVGTAGTGMLGDLMLRVSGADLLLYATTGPGGAGLTAHRLEQDGRAVQTGASVLPGGASAGETPTLHMIGPDAARSVAVTGVQGAGLWALGAPANGQVATTGTAMLDSDLSQIVWQRVNGQDYAYMSRLGSDMIEVMPANPDGTFGAVRSCPGGVAGLRDGIVALRTQALPGCEYLVAATDGAATLVTYRLSGDDMAEVSGYALQGGGPGIARPAALETVAIDGRAFVLVGAAQSSSLSVFELLPGGALRVVDHVIDGRATRFQGLTDLALTQVAGSTYVAAGGADDGVTLFQLLGDGRLVHAATLADQDGLSLGNVAAIDMAYHQGMLDIVVASASEPGVTRLRVDPGAPGQTIGPTGATVLAGGAGQDTLIGSAGSEHLIAGAGRDILRDGAGRDTLEGGAGADLFVLSNDGMPDVITDFEFGQDQLDLSDWTFLRSLSQIAVTVLQAGVRLEYGGEVLDVLSHDGGAVSLAQLGQLDPVPLDRILPGWFTQSGMEEPGGTLHGGPNADQMAGTMQNDRFAAQGGGDRIEGFDGDDTLDGGAGADTLLGGPGSDTYIVDNPGDMIVESPTWQGTDHVYSSVDFWARPQHIENITLIGEGDIRGVGNGLVNIITGNDGNNIIDGGRNNDRLEGGRGDDTYLVRAPGDLVIERPDQGIDAVRAYRSAVIPENVEKLYLQEVGAINAVGNDQSNLLAGNDSDNMLIGRSGRDFLLGMGGHDTFVFDRPFGRTNVDRVADFTSGEDALWIKASLFGLEPGPVAQQQFGLGRAASGDQFVMFDPETGGLWIDRDGTGPLPERLTFILLGDTSPEASDILFY